METLDIFAFVLSVASLAIAFYQYIDKRRIEKKNIDLRNELDYLDKLEKQNKLSSKMTLFYIEFCIKGLFINENLNPLKVTKLTTDKFRDLFEKWKKKLQIKLMSNPKISIIKNSKYNELELFFTSPSKNSSSDDHIIKAILITNEGGNNAIDFKFGFKNIDEEIVIDLIRPREAIMIILSHKDKSNEYIYGCELDPSGEIEYIDEFNNKKVIMRIREPLKIPQIIDPNMNKRG